MWTWLRANASLLQSMSSVVSLFLNVATIWVLVVTRNAANRQANAADRQAGAADRQASASENQVEAAKKMIEVSQRQIETAIEQAKAASDQVLAAKEQLIVAKRQITESLRPILTARMSGFSSETVKLIIKNDGAGVALDVWWMYGQPGAAFPERHRIAEGLMPPKIEREMIVLAVRASHEKVLIGYTSLAGVVSATSLSWRGADFRTEYHPDLGDWARTLHDDLLGAIPSS